MVFRLGASIAVLLASALGSGCALQSQNDPALHTLQLGDRSDTLVVMLPGVKDRAEQFLIAGFVGGEGAPESFDVVVVEPELSDYLSGSIVERLRTDVIAPARARGYDDIWLVGVSIGGYGSLLYAGAFPAHIRGVVLLAPYLGGRRVPRAIQAAGGLRAWQAAAGPSPFVDGWIALQSLTERPDPTIVLGYGGGDRLAETYAPLLATLPRSRIYTVDGGHEWTTWAPLWNEIKGTIDSAARVE
jgi:pimeloyl-ACP methyl ester carboxylesterase